jgi:hypothetical protein
MTYTQLHNYTITHTPLTHIHIGRSTLYARLSDATPQGSLLLLSAFLKFEDIGAVSNIVVTPAPVVVTQIEESVLEVEVEAFPTTSVPISALRDSGI